MGQQNSKNAPQQRRNTVSSPEDRMSPSRTARAYSEGGGLPASRKEDKKGDVDAGEEGGNSRDTNINRQGAHEVHASIDSDTKPSTNEDDEDTMSEDRDTDSATDEEGLQRKEEEQVLKIDEVDEIGQDSCDRDEQGTDSTDVGRDVDLSKKEKEIGIYFRNRGVDSDESASDGDSVELDIGMDSYVAASDINLYIVNEEGESDLETSGEIDSDGLGRNSNTGNEENERASNDVSESIIDTEVVTEGKDTQDTGGATREAVKEAVHTVAEAVTEAVSEVVNTVLVKTEQKSMDSSEPRATHEAVKDAVHTAAAPVYPAMLLREVSQLSPLLTEETAPLSLGGAQDSLNDIQLAIEDSQHLSEGTLTSNTGEDGDSEILRLVRMVVVDAAAAVRIVLTWVIPEKQQHQRYDQYLLRDKKMNRGAFRSIFTKRQREMLQNDPSGETFDVFLLCLLLEHITEKLALSGDDPWVQPGNHLEYQLTAVREFRANVFHGGDITRPELIAKSKVLEEILTKILEAAGKLCDIEEDIVAQRVQEVSQGIEKSKCDEDVQWDINGYGEAILCEEMSWLLVLRGRPQLQKLYDQPLCPTLVPIKELNQSAELDELFTESNISEVGRDGIFTKVDFGDLLSWTARPTDTERSNASRVMLVEGPSGFGKTILTKKLSSNWSKQDNLPRDLENYDLVIRVECKNPYFKSFSDLLKTMMPDAKRMFSDEDVTKCLRSASSLVMIDSLDDLNVSSLQVVHEIMNAAKFSKHMTVLMTSSTGAVEDMHKIIPSDLPVSNFKILGIIKHKRAALATNHYKAIVKLKQDANSDKLEAFFNETSTHLQPYWRSPLNIALLASLWAGSPENVEGVTSVTDLMVKIDEKSQESLLDVLRQHPNTKHFSVSELKDKMRTFVLWLCNEALFSLKKSGGNLSGESIKRLKHSCQSVGIPCAEVIDNFLVKETLLTPSGKRTFYTFPHKILLDFYAALAILNRLLEKEHEVNLTKVLSDLQTVLASHSVSTTRSQEVLRHAHSVLSDPQEPHKRSIIDKINSTVFPPREPTVTSILREGCQPAPTLPIWRFQHTFAILLGFVTLLREDKQDVIRELVLLLERSGLRDREAWLDVLTNSGCDSCVGREMARSVPDVLDIDGDIYIRDGRVAAYNTLMKYARPTKVTVNITHDPREIPRFLELMLSLCQRPCEVQLLLKHDFHHPKVLSSEHDVMLQHVFQWCRMTRFDGQITPATGLVLPTSLTHLSLSFLDAAHYCSLAPILDTLPTRLHALRTLEVLVGVDMVAEALHALPRVRNVHLHLAAVTGTTLAWACECARQLEPENGYDSLTFPGASLNQADIELLQSLLSAASVTVPDGVTVMCVDGNTLMLECSKQTDHGMKDFR